MKKLAFLVVVLATVVMFYRINRYPISFSIYEGLTGLTAEKIIEGDEATIKRVWEKPIRNQAGCSAGIGSADNDIFLIFPTVFFMKLFGYRESYLTLRLTSMIYGILSVWVLYLLGAKLFNRTVGVIAAFFLATSTWALVYSRISYDVSATILFALVCFYLYAACDRPNNPIGYIILGGLMGLAPYFYVPVRIVFLLVVVNMILRMIFEKGYFKSHYQYFILMIACFILSHSVISGQTTTHALLKQSTS
jgi:4-amino-4-deoxy-L-arabinose transferase-like glycosyltransferase